MSGKQYRLMIVLVFGLIWVIYSNQLAFSQSPTQNKNPVSANDLDERIKQIENSAIKLNKRIEAMENKMNSEICAAAKLIEISEKNMIAPKYVTGILIGLIVAFGALITIIIFILKNSIVKQIEEKGEDYTKKINELMENINKLQKEDRHLFAYSYNMAAINEWNRQKFDQAIAFSEKSIKSAEEAWGKEPEDPDKILILNRYRSNLAYFYVEKGKDEERGKAIEYAKMGLKSGEDSHDLDLIDNYLYVIMKFSRLLEDKKEWLKVYDAYIKEIYNASIRTDEEMKVYRDYHAKLSNELL